MFEELELKEIPTFDDFLKEVPPEEANVYLRQDIQKFKKLFGVESPWSVLVIAISHGQALGLQLKEGFVVKRWNDGCIVFESRGGVGAYWSLGSKDNKERYIVTLHK